VDPAGESHCVADHVGSFCIESVTKSMCVVAEKYGTFEKIEEATIHIVHLTCIVLFALLDGIQS